MSITGRDVDFTELVLKFNKETFKWEVASQASDYENYRKQLEYKNNPIVNTIKALVLEHPEGLRITATKLLDAVIKVTGVRPRQKSPQVLSREINDNLQFQLWDFDRIYYEQGNANGGKNGREMYFIQEEHRLEKEKSKQQKQDQENKDAEKNYTTN